MPNIYRTALQVSPERIAALDERDLNELMLDLLKAQAYLAGANAAEVIVNTEGLAKDGGADGTSPAPPSADAWLGNVETTWQFKAGSAGEPSRLKNRGEVRKPIPKETLENGGRFVVVASGSTNGQQGIDDRVRALREDADAVGIPSNRIEVYGSEVLTNWCNQHPAVAARWAGRPGGLWRIADWERSGEHEVEWQPVQAQKDAITTLCTDLDLEKGEVLHLHIFGHPGVGKSRFALELCRGAAWKHFVVYVRQAADIRLLELVDSCADDAGVRLVIVADEVELEQILSLRASVARANRRIRLVTIGPSASPDPERVPGFEVHPLPENVVVDVVRKWHRRMPTEHADFVARFSAGYMRLARLAADTVSRNPTMDVRTILEQRQIKLFLDQMLGDDERSSLHVVSVLTSVGWADEREVEGKAIAAHFGLDWGRVRREVEAFDRRFQIAPRSGRLRNISPTPLGVYLALEAWTIYPAEMRSLPSVLPEAAVDAYYTRLQSLASSPQAGGFAREELDNFFPVADLTDVRAIRRWSALAFANPTMAASRMRNELARRSLDERRAIKGAVRHSLTSGLVALAWSTPTFEDAAYGLALLAEAENESIADSATAEFLQRFSIFFSGTAVAYPVRLQLLLKLLSSESDQLRRLAFRALSRVASRGGVRLRRTPVTRGLPEPEWQPQTGNEYIGAAKLGISALREAVEPKDPAFAEIAGSVIGELRMFLLEAPVRSEVIDLFTVAAQMYPTQRESLRRTVAELVHCEQRYWKSLAPDELAPVQMMLRGLEDTSLSGRLRQSVGAGSNQEDEATVRGVAMDFAAQPHLLVDEWAWLTSGEARRGWNFGMIFGESNLDTEVRDLVRSQSMGPDGRVVCGYLIKRAEDQGVGWLESWLDTLWAQSPERADFVLEATWRLTPTTRGAKRVETILHAGAGTAAVIGQFAYGTWEDKLDQGALRPVLELLASRADGLETAVAMLNQRLAKKPAEIEEWADLVLKLATNGRIIRSVFHESYEWNELAKRVLDRFPRELYRAIVREQGHRTEHHWFLEHGYAAEIARQCVEKDPSGAWEETRPYLEAAPGDAYIFTIGFPEGFIDMMDRDKVLAWTCVDPVARASILAKIVATRFADDSLAGTLIELYGDREEVASAFYSRTVTGGWIGPASEHWGSLARSMHAVAGTANGAGLRRWAAHVAESLDHMAERDRIREEEQRVRD